MTLKSLIQSQATSVFLDTNHFADATISRKPGDGSAQENNLTGVVEEDDASEQTERGQDSLRIGTLYVADTQATDLRDRWVINGETWRTVSIGPVAGGMKEIRISRREEGRHRPMQ